MGPTVHSLCELWGGGVATSIDLTREGAEFNSELSRVKSRDLFPHTPHTPPHRMKRFNLNQLIDFILVNRVFKQPPNLPTKAYIIGR